MKTKREAYKAKHRERAATTTLSDALTDAQKLAAVNAARTSTKAERIDSHGRASTYRIEHVELARPGKWNASTPSGEAREFPLTAESLRQMAADTNEIRDRLQPPMLPDHPAKGRRGPAYGWLGKLYTKDDGSLWTESIGSIPRVMADLIENRAYKRISIGIREGHTDASTGKTYPMLVDHAAILGAAKPVVDTMNDVPSELYEEQYQIAASELTGAVVTLSALPTSEVDMEGNEMAVDQKAIDDAVAAALAKVLSDQNGQVAALLSETKSAVATLSEQNKKLADETAALRETNATRDREARANGARAFVADRVRAGQITPGERQVIEALAVVLSELPSDTVAHLSEGDKTVAITPLDLLKQAVAKRPQVIQFGERSPQNPNEDTARGGMFSEPVVRKLSGMSADDAAKIVDAAVAGEGAVDLDPSLAAMLK